jgi:hypothetical protein
MWHTSVHKCILLTADPWTRNAPQQPRICAWEVLAVHMRSSGATAALGKGLAVGTLTWPA